MKLSDTTDKLFASLMAVQNQGLTLRKNKSAQIVSEKGKYGYNYADLGEVLDTLSEPLKAEGLLMLWGSPDITADTPRQAVGTTLRIVHVESGQFVESTRFMPVHEKATPQGVGSAMSYLRRYLLLEAFNLTAEDDDGHRGSKSPEEKAPNRREVPPKKRGDDPRLYLAKIIGDWAGVAAEDRASAVTSARPKILKAIKATGEVTDAHIDQATKYVQDQITRNVDFAEWMAAMSV